MAEARNEVETALRRIVERAVDPGQTPSAEADEHRALLAPVVTLIFQHVPMTGPRGLRARIGAVQWGRVSAGTKDAVENFPPGPSSSSPSSAHVRIVDPGGDGASLTWEKRAVLARVWNREWTSYADVTQQFHHAGRAVWEDFFLSARSPLAVGLALHGPDAGVPPAENPYVAFPPPESIGLPARSSPEEWADRLAASPWSAAIHAPKGQDGSLLALGETIQRMQPEEIARTPAEIAASLPGALHALARAVASRGGTHLLTIPIELARHPRPVNSILTICSTRALSEEEILAWSLVGCSIFHPMHAAETSGLLRREVEDDRDRTIKAQREEIARLEARMERLGEERVREETRELGRAVQVFSTLTHEIASLFEKHFPDIRLSLDSEEWGEKGAQVAHAWDSIHAAVEIAYLFSKATSAMGAEVSRLRDRFRRPLATLRAEGRLAGALEHVARQVYRMEGRKRGVKIRLFEEEPLSPPPPISSEEYALLYILVAEPIRNLRHHGRRGCRAVWSATDDERGLAIRLEHDHEGSAPESITFGCLRTFLRRVGDADAEVQLDYIRDWLSWKVTLRPEFFSGPTG